MSDAWAQQALILLGLAAFVVAAAWLFHSEARAEKATVVPPERQPAEHEIKTALSDIRAALDRLQSVLERQHDHNETELRAIQRQLDRIESSRRIEDALAGIYRQQRET